MKVYLDYAATGPIKAEVLTEMMPYLTTDYGNPSSMHEWGRAARIAVDESRIKIAKFLNADPAEIIFTSGGTESDNLAIKGMVNSVILNEVKNLDPSAKPQDDKFHVITSQIEHHAILNSCKTLEKSGVEVTYLKPNTDGIIEVDAVKAAIKENTVLVSIMYVNNEIGSVNPIRAIGKMIEKENDARELKILFHTDAVQAAEYQNMDVDYLHVDLLTISGHKIGAPKGVGVLFVKKGVNIMPMMHGGEQEFGRRAGTENVASIVAIGKAVEELRNEKLEIRNEIKNIRDYFIGRILKEIPETELNGGKEFRSPNNVNVYFKYVEGESILMNLDLVGIAASSGSACTSLSLQPSHVIMAVYSDAERAHGSIRFTLGQNSTKEEIEIEAHNLNVTRGHKSELAM